MDSQVLSVAPAVAERIDHLIERSHADYMDLNTILPWQGGVNRGRAAKRADTCWLHGTRYQDGLTQAQRQTLSWLQMARDVSMFIWLEQAIPPLYVGHVMRREGQMPHAVREYMMIFSKEEIVHTLMFRRYLSLAGLSQWGPPAGMQEFFTDQLPRMAPEVGVLFTYLVEAAAEIGAMHCTDDPEVDPLTRQMAVAHHREEMRHIAFGRWIIESYTERAPAEVARLRPMVEGFIARFISQYTYNPELLARAQEIGLEIALPGPADEHAVAEVRRSANNVRLNQERFQTMQRWLQRLGLMGPDATFI